MTARAADRPTATDLRLPAHRHPAPTRTRLATRRLPVLAYVAVLLLIPSLVVVGAIAAGWWRTTGTKLTAAPAVPGGAAESPSAPTSPADVKGSTTVADVARAFPAVTAAEILQAFGAPADTSDTAQLKTLVENGAMDIPAFREWLGAHVTG